MLQLHGRSVRGVQSTCSGVGRADHGPLTLQGTENGLIGVFETARHNFQAREFISVPLRKIQYSFMSGTVPCSGSGAMPVFFLLFTFTSALTHPDKAWTYLTQGETLCTAMQWFSGMQG